jgi:mannosyl-oligosaccharide alpha-1,2-mannosidase
MMLRLRRYRGFLIVAIVVTFGLYHLTQIRNTAHSFGVDRLKSLGNHVSTASIFKSPPIASSTGPPIRVASSPAPGVPLRPASSHSPTATQPAILPDYPESLASSDPTQSSRQARVTEPGETRLKVNDTQSIPDEGDVYDHFESHGQGKLEIGHQRPSVQKSHWKPQKEHFPVPSSSVISLPTGRPQRVPPIQYLFATETSTANKNDEQKLGAIKGAFEHAWSGYKKYAMSHDELTPVSGDFKDPFNGWGATLVDTLDTLWIMDLKDEFEEAVAEVRKIDFKTSVRKDIPLFETVIRYLGGLIAAYDISTGKYQILLEKAVELAEILMGVFDTPNRMPVTYYHWAPSYASQPHRAESRVVLAELGSLSLEFTRLAQLTKENKYYDAIARITNELQAWQSNTKLPGLWPVSVDASGCKKPNHPYAQMAHSASHGPPNLPPSVQNLTPVLSDEMEANPQKQAGKKSALSQAHSLRERQSDDAGMLDGEEAAQPLSNQLTDSNSLSPASEISEKASNSTMDDMDCQPQGLASPPFQSLETFTMGGMSDSTYEYLPKEWLLLGGLVDQYESMYKDAMDVVRDKLLFRPMVKSGRDVLFAGTMKISGVTQKDMPAKPSGIGMEYEGQHLTCFAGGMFALGAKIFGIKADLGIAQRLTDGCIWAYESTRTGIMPEVFHLVPCEIPSDCTWNETAWWEALDPYRTTRQEQARTRYQYQRLLDQGTRADEGDRSKRLLNVSMPVIPAGRTKSDDGHAPVKRDNGVVQAVSRDPLRNRQRRQPNEASEAEDGSPLKPSLTQSEAAQPQDEDNLKAMSQSSSPIFTPKAIASHEDFVQVRIKEDRLPPGFTDIQSKKYILRPEAIESVFIMYRVTGEKYWQEQGWKMFTAIQNYTMTEYGNSAITDVTSEVPVFSDEMESFWLAETLKYFYLLFSDPGVVSLDDYVL